MRHKSGVNLEIEADKTGVTVTAHHPDRPGVSSQRRFRNRYEAKKNLDRVARSIAESQDKQTIKKLIQEAIITAKVLAHRSQYPVEVIESGWASQAGTRNDIAQIWKGDFGKIIGDDGNNYTMMLNSSGRVMVPKDKFNDMFKIVPDEDLLFSDDLNTTGGY